MRKIGKARQGDILRAVKRGREYILHYIPARNLYDDPFIIEVCEAKTGKALFHRGFHGQLEALTMFDLLLKYGNADKFISL